MSMESSSFIYFFTVLSHALYSLGLSGNQRVERKRIWSDCNLEKGMGLVRSACLVRSNGQVIEAHQSL